MVIVGGTARIFSVRISFRRFTLGTINMRLAWVTFISSEKIIKKIGNGIIVE